MRPLITDENFTQKLIRGIIKDAPQIENFRVQRVGLRGADDPDILEWAAQMNGILVSHDYATVPYYANERLKAGLPFSGVLMVPQTANLKQMVEEIILCVECLSDEEWTRAVKYLPL